MTTRAMISSDAPHQAEGSTGQAGEIAHRACWSSTASWTAQGTGGSVTNAQTHRPSSLPGAGGEPGRRESCQEGSLALTVITACYT